MHSNLPYHRGKTSQHSLKQVKRAGRYALNSAKPDILSVASTWTQASEFSSSMHFLFTKHLASNEKERAVSSTPASLASMGMVKKEQRENAMFYRDISLGLCKLPGGLCNSRPTGLRGDFWMGVYTICVLAEDQSLAFVILIFFFPETGLHFVTQAGLKLTELFMLSSNSCNPLASASQTSGA